MKKNKADLPYHPEKKGISAYAFRQKITPYLFLVPGITLFLFIGLFSIAFSIYISFFNWSGVGFATARFEGLNNFKTFLFGGDPLMTRMFFRALLHNTQLALFSVIGIIPIALVVAFVLQNTKWVSFYRTIYFLPMITSGVALFYVWKGIFEPNGALNSLLEMVGLDFLVVSNGLFGDSDTAMLGIVITAIWGGLPGTLLLYYAGLTSIDPTLYEAASVDGASKRVMLWKITWPMLKPFTMIAVINIVNGSFQAFENVYIMTGGGPAGSTEVIGTLLYSTAFLNSQYGLASAMGWTSFLVTGVIAIFSIRGLRTDL